MDRTWDQRAADEELSGYPHTLELRGTPASLSWPDTCVNCGAASSERVNVRRAFYRRARGRRSQGFFGYKVVSVDLPLCGTCAARHRDTVPRLSWFHRYRWFVLNPAHIATLGLIWLLSVIWPTMADTPAASQSGLVAWGLVGICLVGIAWTVAITWWMSRPDRFEPRSDVTSAVLISITWLSSSKARDISTDCATRSSPRRLNAPTRTRSGPSAIKRTCGSGRSTSRHW